jgi:hypothetical protein
MLRNIFHDFWRFFTIFGDLLRFWANFYDFGRRTIGGIHLERGTYGELKKNYLKNLN